MSGILQQHLRKKFRLPVLKGLLMQHLGDAGKLEKWIYGNLTKKENSS
jgi:hypothetical protein